MIPCQSLLVLGGTSDSIQLANKLHQLCSNTYLSAATEYGGLISGERFNGITTLGRKDEAQLRAFIKENDIWMVVDATHPYASGISENAIKVCKELGIRYFRYERSRSISQTDNIVYCSSYEEAAAIANQSEGNILVTTGSNNADKFAAGVNDSKRLKIRILPVSESIIRLEQLGFNADNIIAVKGPFSEEMNYLTMVENRIKVMICKDSGEQGGTDEKLRAAKRAGAKAIVITRPSIDYPNKFEDMDVLVECVERFLNK